MPNECCNRLDLRREVCENCPYLSQCSTTSQENIEEVFRDEQIEANEKIGQDKGYNL